MKQFLPLQPRPTVRFQNGYGHDPIMCFHRWEWNTTFNRWSALVTFYDGRNVFTYPEEQPEGRVLVAQYISNAKTVYEVDYEVALYGSLANIARQCLRTARERGYGRGKLKFKIKRLWAAVLPPLPV